MGRAAKAIEKLPSKGTLRPRKRLSREERSADVREAIFQAAAKVVGEYGYANASIAKITELAGFAQGTFYLYFESRQELFDELLPHVGADMLRYIRPRVAGARNIYDMEERGIRAFFDYLNENPGFIRVLNEAETAAPIAHRKHYQVLATKYVAALERAVRAGEIRNFDREELETVAYMMMASRSYLYMRYFKNRDQAKKQSEKVIKAYMKVVKSGLN